MRRIERIQRMEQNMDLAAAAVEALEKALEDYAQAQGAIFELEEYMDGGKWLKDYDADEAGLLPPDLKRGVLSEDGLYNLLTDNSRLLRLMGRLCARAEDR